MPVQVSNKKQFTLMLMLLVTLLVIVEIIVNIWLYNFYTCEFENNEIFKNVDPEINRKVCLENIGYDFTKQELSWASGTKPDKRFGGIDENIVYFNSEGFRGPEFTKDKPENTYRIFTMGGSTTFGSGVLDHQTFPYYLGKMFDDANLNFKVKVINAGKAGFWSKQETKMVNKRLVNFEPDLFIVYDGINDSGAVREGRQESATVWKESWMEICELGKNQGFETIITLQPFVGTGKKILTEQEYKNFLKVKKMGRFEFYEPFIEELDKLKNHCTLTADLRGIFDHIEEPIYYDTGHVGPRGNEIIAKKMFQLSLPIVLKGSQSIVANESNEEYQIIEINSSLISNDFDIFMEQTYQISRNILSPYKTPKVFSLIFD